MGEFNKDPNQGGFGKDQGADKQGFEKGQQEQQGFEKGQQQQQGDKEQFGEKSDKPAFDQFEKGQQQQEGGKEQFGEKTPDYGQDKGPQQQEGAEKPQYGTEKEQSGDKQQGDYGEKPRT